MWCSQMQKFMNMSRDDMVVNSLSASFDKMREWPYCVGSPEGIKEQAFMPRQARLVLALAGTPPFASQGRQSILETNGFFMFISHLFRIYFTIIVLVFFCLCLLGIEQSLELCITFSLPAKCLNDADSANLLSSEHLCAHRRSSHI